MTAADADSGSLISERVAGGILPKVLTPAGAGRHRATGSDG